MKQFLDRLAQFILNTKEIRGIKVDAWYLGKLILILAGFLLAIAIYDTWAAPRMAEWAKKRFREGSLMYRFWFFSPFDKIPPFSLPDHLSRQQADRLFLLPWFAFLLLPFFPPNLSRQTRMIIVTISSLLVTASVNYFWFSGRKNFRLDPNYKPSFSPFRFLAEDMQWSREKADRTFLREVPLFIALMLAAIPLERLVLDQKTVHFHLILDCIWLPLAGLPSLFYLFKYRKRFKPERLLEHRNRFKHVKVSVDNSRFAFFRNPKLRSVVHSIVKVALPTLVFCGLITIFVPDDLNNPLSRIIAPTLFWGGRIFVISLPSIVIHSWVRGTVFGSQHRVLVAFLSWLVPPTLMYLARYPTGARKDFEFAPIFAAIWLLTTFCGASVLAYALVSGKALKPDSATSISSDNPSVKFKDDRSSRLSLKEILGVIAAIANIAIALWTILRDVTH